MTGADGRPRNRSSPLSAVWRRQRLRPAERPADLLVLVGGDFTERSWLACRPRHAGSPVSAERVRRWRTHTSPLREPLDRSRDSRWRTPSLSVPSRLSTPSAFETLPRRARSAKHSSVGRGAPRRDGFRLDQPGSTRLARTRIHRCPLAGLRAAVFGLAPAIRGTRSDPAGPLKVGTLGATGGRARSRLATGLLVTQMALAVLLSVGAGLLLRTMANLARVDVGFDPAQVLVFEVDPTGAPRAGTLAPSGRSTRALGVAGLAGTFQPVALLGWIHR